MRVWVGWLIWEVENDRRKCFFRSTRLARTPAVLGRGLVVAVTER